jgi:hypothetical protein
MRCTYLTLRGRPCRNPAAPGTEPPACGRHRSSAYRQLPLEPDTLTEPPTEHFYFPAPTADELRALEAGELVPDLSPEVALVRVVLRRLLACLDAAAGDLPPEELRRISSLVFTGARTVAHLLGQKSARPEEAQEWLAAVLPEMAERYIGNQT